MVSIRDIGKKHLKHNLYMEADDPFEYGPYKRKMPRRPHVTILQVLNSKIN